GGARSILSGNQRSRNLCGRRCAPPLGQRGDLRRGRGGHGGEAGSPISGAFMTTLRPEHLQEVRSIPPFSTLSDEQLDCLGPGEIVEAAAGTVLAPEGERNGLFQVLLEGELRITRVYDRQTVLMAVGKPGNY